MAKSNITVEFSSKEVKAKLKKLRNALTVSAQHSVVRKAADIWHQRLTQRTPRRWTGNTAKAWKVVELPSGEVAVTNPTKAMLYLERGTKAHGPRKAKRLFIPLTRKAAQAGARGVMSANKAASNAALWASYGTGKKKKIKLPFIYGKDYVFAKRVKGIKAMWIVRNSRGEARVTYRLLMTKYIRDILRS